MVQQSIQTNCKLVLSSIKMSTWVLFLLQRNCFIFSCQTKCMNWIDFIIVKVYMAHTFLPQGMKNFHYKNILYPRTFFLFFSPTKTVRIIVPNDLCLCLFTIINTSLSVFYFTKLTSFPVWTLHSAKHKKFYILGL